MTTAAQFRPSVLAIVRVDTVLEREGMLVANPAARRDLARKILLQLFEMNESLRGSAAFCRCPPCERGRAHLGDLRDVRDFFEASSDLTEVERDELAKLYNVEEWISANLNGGCVLRARDATIEQSAPAKVTRDG